MISSSSMMRTLAGEGAIRTRGPLSEYERLPCSGSLDLGAAPQRQHQTESGALVRVALARQRSAVLLDDSVRHRQAEPGPPAALGLSGEKRIVDAREVFRRDADARVGNLDH